MAESCGDLQYCNVTLFGSGLLGSKVDAAKRGPEVLPPLCEANAFGR